MLRKKPDFWYAVYERGFFYYQKPSECIKRRTLFICIQEIKKKKQSEFLKNEKQYVRKCGK